MILFLLPSKSCKPGDFAVLFPSCFSSRTHLVVNKIANTTNIPLWSHQEKGSSFSYIYIFIFLVRYVWGRRSRRNFCLVEETCGFYFFLRFSDDLQQCILFQALIDIALIIKIYNVCPTNTWLQNHLHFDSVSKCTFKHCWRCWFELFLYVFFSKNLRQHVER